MKIPIINPTTYLEEKTWLTSNYTSGTTLTVKNSTGFSDNSIVLVGEPGRETTETAIINGTPGSITTITINSALSFSHGVDTPLYELLFNQAEIYRSTDGGSNYSLLATVSLTYDAKVTTYEDSSGSSSYKYKIRLKNSETGNLSSFSDVQSGSGWERGSVGRMIRNVRRKIRDMNSRKYHDWEIMEELKNSSDEILSEIPNAYWTLRESSRTTTASTYKYYLPTNYRAMLYLLYEYNPNSSSDIQYPLEHVDKVKFLYQISDKNQSNDDYLSMWTELPGDSDYPNGYFGVWPTPESSNKNMTLWYFINEPNFDSYGDVTNCPLPQVLENRTARELTNDNDDYNKFDRQYERGLIQLKKLQRRSFHPMVLRTWHGINPSRSRYGRGSARKTQADVENYW